MNHLHHNQSIGNDQNIIPLLKKVLVIRSYPDKMTLMELDLVRSSPRFADFIVEYCYPGDSVYESVTTAIDDLHPDVILLHTGSAFSKQPVVILEAMLEIKRIYPNVRLGVEHKANYRSYRHDNYMELETKYPDTIDISDDSFITWNFSSLDIFEDTEEMHFLEELFF